MSSMAREVEGSRRFLTAAMHTQEGFDKGEESLNAPVADNIKDSLLSLSTPGRILKVKPRQISINPKAVPSLPEVQKSSADVLGQHCHHNIYMYTCNHAALAPLPAPRVIHVNCPGVPLGKVECDNMSLYSKCQRIDDMCTECSREELVFKGAKKLEISDKLASPKTAAMTEVAEETHRYRGKITQETMKRGNVAEESAEALHYEQIPQKKKRAAAIENIPDVKPMVHRQMRWTVVDSHGLGEEEKMLGDSEGIKVLMKAEALKDAAVKTYKKGLISGRKGFGIHKKHDAASVSSKGFKDINSTMASDDKDSTSKQGDNEIKYVDQGYDAADWDMIEEFEYGDWIKIPETKLPT